MNAANQLKNTDEAVLDILVFIESEVLANGLVALLQRIPRIRGIRTVHDEAVLDPVTDVAGCDVVIVSIDLWPGLAARLGDEAPRVLVLGDDLEHQDPELLASLRSDGFTTVSSLSVASLDDTLARTVLGAMPMPATLARHLLTGVPTLLRGPEHRSILTVREQETLNLLAKGLSNKQIARLLRISPHGAKRLVGAVLLKLGSPNRTAAVVTAMKAGLV